MSDLSVMVERVAEAQELERLRREVAELRARWDDYEAVSARAQHLGLLQWSRPSSMTGTAAMLLGAMGGQQFGPSSLQKHMQAEHFRLFGF